MIPLHSQTIVRHTDPAAYLHASEVCYFYLCQIPPHLNAPPRLPTRIPFFFSFQNVAHNKVDFEDFFFFALRQHTGEKTRRSRAEDEDSGIF